MSHIIVTETLAKLYEKHDVFDKAKEVYEHLQQQYPDRTDLTSKISELDSKIAQSRQQTSSDFRETLDKGLADDQEGIPLDAALDAFGEKQQKQAITQFDPAVLDQIMVMTDLDESVVPESVNDIKIPPVISENQLSSNALPQKMHRWIDLLMMKRKMNQLKQLKQKIQ